MSKHRLALIFLMFVLCRQSADGQVTLGTRLAPGLGDVSSNSSSEKTIFVPSVQVGLVSQFHLHKTFALQPELTYTRKFVDFQPSTLGSITQRNFLGLNFLGNYFIPISHTVSFNLMVGPYFLIVPYDDEYNNLYYGNSWVTYIASTQKTEFGFQGGAGAFMSLGSGRLALDIRFSRSQISQSSTGGEYHYANLGVGLGYQFIFRKK